MRSKSAPWSHRLLPSFKAGYDVTNSEHGVRILWRSGPVTGFDPFRDQHRQIIPCIDLNFSPNWEFNAGVGVGRHALHGSPADKVILGRRFDFQWQIGFKKRNEKA
jgi:hypothetical protein